MLCYNYNMKKKTRKTKLKTMKRKQRIEKRLVKTYVNTGTYDKATQTVLPVVKTFEFNKVTQNWNPNLDFYKQKFYVSKTIQSFCEYLKDLFCVPDNIVLDIRYRRNNQSGVCYRVVKFGYKRILIGAKGGIRASILIHEFLHAAGFHHENNINGYSNYAHRCTKDTYSRLICKDIFGKKEVLLN